MYWHEAAGMRELMKKTKETARMQFVKVTELYLTKIL